MYPNTGYNGRTRNYFRSCDHEWKYKLTIGKKKIYQCDNCGKIREEPLNVILKLSKKRKK